MDTFLLIVTGVAVVVAIATSTLAWRVTRGERRRTLARVAALAAAAGVETLRAGMMASVDESAALDDFVPDAAASVEPRPETPAAATVGPMPGMFGQAVPDSGSGGRQYGLLAAAAVVAVLVGGGSLLMIVSGRAPGAARAEVRVPLELVALGHERIDGQLAVSGVVQNPGAASTVEALEAQVRVFDAAGIMIATRSAPVSVAALAAGQQVRFTVTLGEATTAARYRVSFASRGSMLAHVDRRTNLPAAVTADAR